MDDITAYIPYDHYQLRPETSLSQQMSPYNIDFMKKKSANKVF